MTQKILVCGWRGFKDPDYIDMVLREYLSCHDVSLMVHGGNGRVVAGEVVSGCDLFAAQVFASYGIATIEYAADWSTFGRSAGPLRNKMMLLKERPNEVWAFHYDLGLGSGTRDMVNRAYTAGVPVKLYIQKGWEAA